MKRRREQRQLKKDGSQRKSKLDNMATLSRIEERVEEEDEDEQEEQKVTKCSPGPRKRRVTIGEFTELGNGHYSLPKILSGSEEEEPTESEWSEDEKTKPVSSIK